MSRVSVRSYNRYVQIKQNKMGIRVVYPFTITERRTTHFVRRSRSLKLLAILT